MKKKFLSFVLAICLILPCAFALTACGGDDEPKTLAGKTIQCSDLYDEFNLNNSLFLSYNEGGLGGTNYQKEITYNELLEMTLGTEVFSYPNNSTPTTLEEAKVSFQQMIKGMFCTISVNPWVHFSDDLTKADLYYSAEAMANGTSAKTFDDVSKETHPWAIDAIEEMVETYYNSGKFQHTLDYLVPLYESPFSFYEQLSVYWIEQKYLFPPEILHF